VKMNFLLGLIPDEYQTIAKIIAVIALCAGLLFAWHEFTGHYKDIGFHSRDLEVLKLTDANKGWSTQFGKLTESIGECNAKVNALQTISNKMKEAGIQASSEAEKRAVGFQNQIDWYANLLNQPHPGKTCADALKQWRTH